MDAVPSVEEVTSKEGESGEEMQGSVQDIVNNEDGHNSLRKWRQINRDGCIAEEIVVEGSSADGSFKRGPKEILELNVESHIRWMYYGCIKDNNDGALSEDGKAVVGGVFCNHQGLVQTSYVERTYSNASIQWVEAMASIQEAMALSKGMDVAEEIGFQLML
ncbi:uncharacterized protein A4U43_C04F13740 [Asparagus officinalis]|uniref:Uncharacterized protein n=1 Tax=Asparagus officinalis TaxID=4686 RepID=A0A5P1F3D1_ASPOF|nr:uncharacterized protein A4U43_C04F13740 [Asparagus officinalis]